MDSRLPWPGAYPPLRLSLSHSPSPFFFFSHPLLCYLLRLALSIYRPSYSTVLFSLRLSLSISQCRCCSVASFSSAPLWYAPLSTPPTPPVSARSHSAAPACCPRSPCDSRPDQHDWTWPPRVPAAGPSSQLVPRGGPLLILKIYYR